ncbi:MAG: DNA replication protein DnaC [Candidatus Coatesbacteria bacterium]|nr:DNA replication protein DnaC [Candidatus Coatesbacteria bacterium]
MTDEKCPRCGGEGWLRIVDAAGRDVVRPCPCRMNRRRAGLLAASRIPPRYEHCTLDNYIAQSPTQKRAMRASRSFIDEFPHLEAGLLYSGPCGVGKTHLAVGVLREIAAEKGYSCLFADARELIGEIRRSFDDGSPIDHRSLIDRVLSVDLLLLDDLGAYHLTSWVLDTFGDIITRRFNARRHMLITTNYPDRRTKVQKETLEDRVGSRLRSRLYEMCRQLHVGGVTDFREDIIAPRYEED